MAGARPIGGEMRSATRADLSYSREEERTEMRMRRGREYSVEGDEEHQERILL